MKKTAYIAKGRLFFLYLSTALPGRTSALPSSRCQCMWADAYASHFRGSRAAPIGRGHASRGCIRPPARRPWHTPPHGRSWHVICIFQTANPRRPRPRPTRKGGQYGPAMHLETANFNERNPPIPRQSRWRAPSQESSRPARIAARLCRAGGRAEPAVLGIPRRGGPLLRPHAAIRGLHTHFPRSLTAGPNGPGAGRTRWAQLAGCLARFRRRRSRGTPRLRARLNYSRNFGNLFADPGFRHGCFHPARCGAGLSSGNCGSCDVSVPSVHSASRCPGPFQLESAWPAKIRCVCFPSLRSHLVPGGTEPPFPPRPASAQPLPFRSTAPATAIRRG